MVFPVWNFGYPAILKGFIDRVFLPGVSFVLTDGKVQGNLQNIRKLAAVTTYGGTWMRAFLCGDPPRKSVMGRNSGLRSACCWRRSRSCCWSMNRQPA